MRVRLQARRDTRTGIKQQRLFAAGRHEPGRLATLRKNVVMATAPPTTSSSSSTDATLRIVLDSVSPISGSRDLEQLGTLFLRKFELFRQLIRGFERIPRYFYSHFQNYL